MKFIMVTLGLELENKFHVRPVFIGGYVHPLQNMNCC